MTQTNTSQITDSALRSERGYGLTLLPPVWSPSLMGWGGLASSGTDSGIICIIPENFRNYTVKDRNYKDYSRELQELYILFLYLPRIISIITEILWNKKDNSSYSLE